VVQRKPRTAASRRSDERKSAERQPMAGRSETSPDKSYDFFLFALKAALAINGGAAIALIALLGNLIKEHALLSVVAGPAGWSLRFFAFGVVSSIVAGFLSFSYLRDGVEKHLVWAGLALTVSIVCFLTGVSNISTAVIATISSSQ